MRQEQRQAADKYNLRARIADIQDGREQSLAVIAKQRAALKEQLAALDEREAAVTKEHDDSLRKWNSELKALEG